MACLKTNTILSLGTVHQNRLQNALLLDKRIMIKLPSGSMSEYVTNI